MADTTLSQATLDPHATAAPQADGTVVPGVPPVSEAPALPRIADRYESDERLGAGANGRVYRARDRLTGEHVAVKLVPAPTSRELDRIRAEVTALRWLRLPGVAAMRDDGLDGDEYFVVMDLVEGQPFLGPRRREWTEIAPSVLTFLEVLARVHLAGVVHRDLKPANVLVDAAGQPVIVDFGLARGAALTQDWNRAGTPRYVAPEQAQGLACGPQADLYAVGVMLYEALSGGWLPQVPTGAREMLLARIQQAPRPLGEVAPFVPPTVAAVVDRLVARDPAQRPASALEVIEALGGRPPVALGQTLARVLGGRSAVPAERLRLLFAGPDLFLHLREDAAEVLWQRTGGHAPLVAEEVHAWVQAGLCTWEGPVLRIDRVAIERLRTGVPLAVAPPPPPTLSMAAVELVEAARRAWPDTSLPVLAAASGLSAQEVAEAGEELVRAGLAWPLPDGRLGLRPVARPALDPFERAVQAEIAAALPDDSDGRLRHLLASGAAPAVVLPVAHRVVDRLFREGRHPVAMAVLELALPLARRGTGLPEHEEALLVAWAKLALAQEGPADLERALYELGRATHRTALVERVEELLYAGRVRFSDEPERCRALLARVRPFADEDLESWRVGIGFAAAAQVSREEARRYLDGLAGWAEAGSDLRRGKLMRWQGLQAYVEGRFEAAARLHAAAVPLATDGTQRMTGLVNAANALLDAGQLAEASQVAERARVLSRQLGHARSETLACCTARQVAYRSRQPGRARPELVEAAGRVTEALAGFYCFSEAGYALRSGDRDLARRLGRRGAEAYRLGGHEDCALLLEALVLATGQPAPAAAEALARRGLGLADPSFALQIIGFVRIATGGVIGTVGDVRRLAARAGVTDAERIIDIISTSEALAGALDPWTGEDLAQP